MIDLHVHSTASDGTFAPAELARQGRDFSVMALTDHDNCDGVDEFLCECKIENGKCKIEGVPSTTNCQLPTTNYRLAGVELSVEPGEGYDKFHLLGLGVDSGNEGLKRFLRRILDGRNARNDKILARFAEIGIVIPHAEIDTYAHGEVLARPHFANWLVDHGYAPDISTAFSTYLTPSSPPETNCYITRYHPDPGEAFDVIHAAGGVAVMAHPRYWTKDPARLREGLARLKARGLDGIEAVYQANQPEETIDHVRAARELGLCMTAGSDFHGTNKPTIKLGMTVDDESTFIAPFLERLDFWRKAATA